MLLGRTLTYKRCLLGNNYLVPAMLVTDVGHGKLQGLGAYYRFKWCGDDTALMLLFAWTVFAVEHVMTLRWARGCCEIFRA